MFFHKNFIKIILFCIYRASKIFTNYVFENIISRSLFKKKSICIYISILLYTKYYYIQILLYTKIEI